MHPVVPGGKLIESPADVNLDVLEVIRESHGAWRSNVLVLSDVGVGGTAPGDKSEHVAVVVPRKHLNKEVASE